MSSFTQYIRDITDFPKAGIVFKDITPLLQNPDALADMVLELSKPFINHSLTAVVGMEARGFIFAVLVAQQLKLPFIPLRKAGKLPAQTESVEYTLEYGRARMEIHRDALSATDNVLVVDDLLATGGTAQASCALVELLGAKVAALAFAIELDFLAARKNKLAQYTVHSVLHY